jgi:ParB-like chromosome segregation protein Spo0J
MAEPTLFDNMVDNLVSQVEQLAAQVDALPLAAQVDALNRMRKALHHVSPFKDEPIDCVLWVPAEIVNGNDYNPNKVAPPEMKLLKHSIRRDGYTQPVVGWDTGEIIEVVDGEHRSRVGREDSVVKNRVHGHLPVTLVNHGRTGINDRMASTIRHNRARGVHGVTPMADIVASMIQRGWSDDEIAAEVGMDADEVLRYKQNVGLPELFKATEYSRAWE